MKVRAVTLGFTLLLCVFAGVIFNVMSSTMAAMMFLVYFFVVGVISCNASKNIYILLFMVAFFVFLLGRPMIVELTGYDDNFYPVKISRDTLQHTYFLITLSMVFVFVGYYGAKLLKFPQLSINENKFFSETTVDNIRCYSKISTIVFGVALLLINIERAIYVSVYGYLDSYIDLNSNLPGVVSQLAELYPTSFALYLSTMPNRKESKSMFYIHIVVMGLYLLTGKRYEAVAAVLLLILYFVLRNQTGEEKWFGRKHVIAILLAVPFVLVFLIAMESWRADRSVDATFGELIADFFSSVGGSSIIISYEDMYHEGLASRDVWFSFGNLWKSVNGNIIGRLFGGDTVYANQTIENALYGHSLSAAIMYKINPSLMFAGGGIGSCYIAELMCDFSYVGVALGSAIIGMVMQKCSGLIKGKFIHNFLVVFIATNMFRVPRDSFDHFFYQFFGIKNILFLVLICFVASSYSVRIKLNKQQELL